MSWKEPWRGKGSEVWDLVFSVEIDIQEGYKNMRIIREEGVVFLRIGIVHTVHQGEQEGFQPSGAGFGSGNKDDISVMSLEVFLEW